MFTICFDTICSGYEPVLIDDKPAQFETEQAALAEMKSDPGFYKDCFVTPMNQIGHKTIYFGGSHEKPI